MKNKSLETRHQFYRYAYTIITDKIGSKYPFAFGICNALAQIVYGDAKKFQKITPKKFPELHLFKESNYEGLYWLADTDRLLVLAFCMAMIEEKTCRHKPLDLGYLAWHTEAERRMKKGWKQKQCQVCKHWFWKDEM